MEGIIEKIAKCIEFGKINKAVAYPPSMKGELGADELTQQALNEGITPSDILQKGLIAGMERIGVKFKMNQVFVPQVLMSAKAMSTAMEHLRQYFNDGTVSRKGTVIIGTVEGDLHDIGKNLVAMVLEGNGYEVIDLGVDVKAEKYIEALNQHPNAFVCMSALLTTTMINMEKINRMLKGIHPSAKTFVGGAPVTADFAKQIGVDYYSDDPQGLVEILNNLCK